MKNGILFCIVFCLSTISCRKDPTFIQPVDDDPFFAPDSHLVSYVGNWTSTWTSYFWRISEGATHNNGTGSGVAWTQIHFLKEDTALFTPESAYFWLSVDNEDGGVINIDSLFNGFSSSWGGYGWSYNSDIQIRGPEQDSLIIHLETGHSESDGLNYESYDHEIKDYLLFKVE
jgi:hypothetical protein